MKISLIGYPGSGKGTIANILSEKFKVTKIGAGDLLRNEVENETENGKKIKDSMKEGKLAPNEMVNTLVRNKIEKLDGYILDGFPRAIEQLKTFTPETEPEIVFKIALTKKQARERIQGRLLCNNCGEIFHKMNRPPKTENTCDKCGKELQPRNDISSEAIENRFRQYEEETTKIEDYFLNEGKLEEINGEYNYPEIDKIVKQIENKIKERS